MLPCDTSVVRMNWRHSPSQRSITVLNAVFNRRCRAAPSPVAEPDLATLAEAGSNRAELRLSRVLPRDHADHPAADRPPWRASAVRNRSPP